jgi:hypothetical protein
VSIDSVDAAQLRRILTAQLVAQGKTLKEEVSTHGQG